MSISFPYRQKTIKEGVIPDPTVRLALKTSFGIRKFDFLVDSGADTTTIPIKLAQDFLNFKPDTSHKELVSGIEGRPIEAYRSFVEILLGGHLYKIRCVLIRSDVIPLLGRLDIWDKFTIIFDNMEKEVVFKGIKV